MKRNGLIGLLFLLVFGGVIFVMVNMVNIWYGEATIRVKVMDANFQPLALGWTELEHVGPEKFRQGTNIDQNGHVLLGGTMPEGKYRLKIWATDQKLDTELLYETDVEVKSGAQSWDIRLEQVSQQITMVIAPNKAELDRVIPPRERFVKFVPLEKYRARK